MVVDGGVPLLLKVCPGSRILRMHKEMRVASGCTSSGVGQNVSCDAWADLALHSWRRVMGWLASHRLRRARTSLQRRVSFFSSEKMVCSS